MRMNYKYRLLSFAICLFLFVGLLSGCSVTPEISEDTFGVYYIDSTQTGLVKEKFNLKGNTASEKIDLLIDELSTNRADVNTTCAIPDDVVVSEYELVDGELVLHFNREYQSLGSVREVLLRSAVAKTMLQLDEVESVSFYIADEPVKDASGNVTGKMTEDSFIDNFGTEEEALESATFVLYYATADGQNLVKKSRVIHFNNSMTVESVVLTYLTKAPDSDDDAKAVLSPSVKVISATTKEGTCYVKLDSSFLSQLENVSTNVAIYGIVNSLTELDNVNRVDISIDTGKGNVVPKSDAISGVYEPDMSLVKK